jgi:hypothetical protein
VQDEPADRQLGIDDEAGRHEDPDDAYVGSCVRRDPPTCVKDDPRDERECGSK